jgi:hypothetical protein
MVLSDHICTSRAVLFRSIHDENTSSILWLLFSALSIFLTAAIRILVLGYCLRTSPSAPRTQPTTAPCARCQHIPDDELPSLPRFEPTPPSQPKISPEEQIAKDKERLLQVPSIPHFVICTFLAILNVLAMVLLAFAIQSFLYCGSELTSGTLIANRRQSAYAVFMWVIYACSTSWASSGVFCWAIWARNLLGGPDAAERWPIRSDLGFIVLVGVLMVPLLLVALVVAVICNGLRMCVCGIGKGLWRFISGRSLREIEVVEMEGAKARLEQLLTSNTQYPSTSNGY